MKVVGENLPSDSFAYRHNQILTIRISLPKNSQFITIVFFYRYSEVFPFFNTATVKGIKNLFFTQSKVGYLLNRIICKYRLRHK